MFWRWSTRQRHGFAACAAAMVLLSAACAACAPRDSGNAAPGAQEREISTLPGTAPGPTQARSAAPLALRPTQTAGAAPPTTVVVLPQPTPTPVPLAERCARAEATLEVKSPDTDRLPWRAAAIAQPVDALPPLQRLAERLLAERFAVPATSYTPSPRVQLFAGELPPDLPFELPLPPSARLVGSALGAGRYDCATARLHAILDVPPGGAAGYDAAQNAVRFYAHELAARGWHLVREEPPQAGFVPAWQGLRAAFCIPKSNLSLYVVAWPRPADWVEVHLTLASTSPEPGPCSRGAPPQQTPFPGWSPAAARAVPLLHGPPSFVRESVYAGPTAHLVELETAGGESAAALQAHLAPQLEDAGWRRRAAGAAGTAAWSQWDASPDGAWEAFLLVLEWPGRSWRTVFGRVIAVAPPEGIAVEYPAPVAPWPPTQHAPDTGDSGDHDAPLRDLIGRLVSQRDVHPLRLPDWRSVVAAALPPDWPAAFPLPPQERLLGSIVTVGATKGKVYGTEVLLDTATPREDVLAWARQTLPALGWRRVTGKNASGQAEVFCAADDTTEAVVRAWGPPGDVRLMLIPILPQAPPCDGRDDGGWRPPYFGHGPTFPPLSLPGMPAPTAVPPQAPYPTAIPGPRFGSVADAATTLPPDDVLALFEPQLVAAGWTHQAGGQAAPIVWSAWRREGGAEVAGQEWEALLFALDSPEQPHRTFWLQAVDVSPPLVAAAVAAKATAARAAEAQATSAALGAPPPRSPPPPDPQRHAPVPGALRPQDAPPAGLATATRTGGSSMQEPIR